VSRPLLLALLLAPAACAAHERQRTFPVGDGPGVLVVLDANSDANADVVTANEKGGDATVLLGDGKGGFTEPTGSPVRVGQMPNDIAVADFDKDGRTDLAFANHETQRLTVLRGDGKGGFAPMPGSPLEVAVRPHPHGVAAGDFDGDGNSDLITDSWADDRLQYFLGDGKGRFDHGHYVRVGRHPYQRIRAADLNGDGAADIVSPNLEGNDVTILLADRKGGFVEPTGSPFPCGDSPFNVAIGDVDADGTLDLAIVNSPSSATVAGRDGLSVLLGDGHGAFHVAKASPYSLSRYPNLVAIGDLDRDGRGEIAVSSPDLDLVTVFAVRDRAVAKLRELRVPGHPKGMAIADVDGDGIGDLVIADNAARAVTVVPGGR
jgi:hypothetical protein